MTLAETVREHRMRVHAEWLGLPGYNADIDAAVAEMEFVSEYVRAYFRLPPHAEGQVEHYHATQRYRARRRNGWSIFDLVVE
jgi:hypothetical protein